MKLTARTSRKLKLIFLFFVSTILSIAFNNCTVIRSSNSSIDLSSLEAGVIADLSSDNTINDKISIGHADYLTSVMTSLFVNPTSTSAQSITIKARIKALISNQVASMGGPCNRYEGNCPGGDQSSAPMVPLSNAVRKGYIIRACEEVLSQDEAVTTALANVNLVTTSAATDANIISVLNLFFPGREVTADILSDLKTQHQAAIGLGQTTTDAWRFVFVGLCTSPLLEML